MRIALLAGLVLGFAMTTAARAIDAVLLHAAGSLRDVLTEVATEFQKSSSIAVTPKFGASPNASCLAMFILSGDGQRIIAKYGFAAPSLPKE
jgi:ABC-type molybdate transport system substrate-binding protein